jgi:hypothetical protein
MNLNKRLSKVSLPSNFNQNSFNTIVIIPICQHGQLGRVDLAIDLAHKRQVDARDELDCRRSFGIFIATEDLEAVDSVLVHSLCSLREGEIIKHRHNMIYTHKT